LSGPRECEKISVSTMTLEQEKLAWELINNPPPGSKLAEAKEYGIDLTLLVENLKLTVTGRLQKLEAAATFLRKVRSSKTLAS
jgi:hypothetical protein